MWSKLLSQESSSTKTISNYTVSAIVCYFARIFRAVVVSRNSTGKSAKSRKIHKNTEKYRQIR